MKNAIVETIMERRSIRAYKEEQISEEQLEILINAALISPTAVNSQNFHFTFVQNKDLILELEKDVVAGIVETGDEKTIETIKSRNNKIFYDAPTVILISAKETRYSNIDSGIAVQSIALAAKGIGLDSVILGMPRIAFSGKNADKWKKEFQFPAEFDFTIAIAVGYGNMEGRQREVDRNKMCIIK